MLTRIKISGFKTFRDFEMEFSPMTVIAGMNASGKSNLLDALQLLSMMAKADDLRTAFKGQRGEPIELFTQYGEDWYADEMEFELDLLLNRQVRDGWGGTADLTYTRLCYQLKIQRRKNGRGLDGLFVANEHLAPIPREEDRWVQNFIPAEKQDHWCPTGAMDKQSIPCIYMDYLNTVPAFVVEEGFTGNRRVFPSTAATRTVMSAFDSVEFPHIFAAREEMRSWKFLQLSPQALREPTQQDVGASDRITQNGGNLAAALYRISLETPFSLQDISRRLNNLLPNLTDVRVLDDKANKQFLIKIQSEDGREFSSRVLSEGTLRLLTLLLFLYDDQHRDLLCFEEPENGVHPFRLKAMAALLQDLSVDFSKEDSPLRQVIVNTHSPILLNEVFALESNGNAAIWFAQLVTRIAEVEGRKMKMRISHIRPVEMASSHLSLHISDSERKMTLAGAAAYLHSADFENTFKTFEQ